MKKITALLLGLAMTASLAACGASVDTTEVTSEVKETAEAAAETATEAAETAKEAVEDHAEEIVDVVEYLTGKKIGVQLGTTGDVYAVDDFGSDFVEEFNKGSEAVEALKSGKLDAVIIDNEPAKAFAAANEGLKVLSTEYISEDYAMCFAKGSELTEQFNTAIAELKEDGTLDAILDKYINGTEGAEGYVTPEGTEYPNGELHMATNAYFPPYEYYEGDDIVGIDAEFAKAICDKLGYDLVIDDMEFATIITAVNSGKADFGAAGMTVTEDRLQNVDFSDSYCTGVQSIIVRDE